MPPRKTPAERFRERLDGLSDAIPAARRECVRVRVRRNSRQAGPNFSSKGFTAMDLPDFLTQDDHGYVQVAGHRVGLGEIVFFFKQGDSPEMLHARFPTIALPLFYKAIAYYLENQLAVDEYCGQQAEEMARQRAAARSGPNLDELRRRRGDQLAQGA